MTCYELVKARGHPNIQATHRTTIEVTKNSHLTLRGDCIIGVSADRGARDLSSEFKEYLKNNRSILLVILEANGLEDYVLAQGHVDLVLSDGNKIVLRRSSYIEPATIGVFANKAAFNLKRELIKELKDPSTVLHVHLYALRLDEITSKNTHIRSVFEDKSTLSENPRFKYF